MVETVAITILFGSFILLMLLGYPLSLGLGVASILTVLYLGLPLELVAQNMVMGLNNYVLLAIPLFILAGEIMNACGMIHRLINFANAMVGRIRGGLAIVNIFASMLFGGISGSATGDTVCIGTALIPSMKKNGYPADFSAAVTVSGSVQGMLIPPSHHLILYSMIVSGVSVGQLYAAGIVPGIFLGLCLILWVYFISRKNSYAISEKLDTKTKIKYIIESIPVLLNMVIVAGSVILGICTVTESGAIAVLYAIVIGVLYKELTWGKFKLILVNSLSIISSIMSILLMTMAFGWLLTYLRIPALLSGLFLSLTSSPNILLTVVNIWLIFLGTILEPLPILFLTVPMLTPILIAAGVNMVHFGILFTLAMGIAILSPPVGSTIFAGAVISQVPLSQLFRTMIPFYVVMIIVLFILTYIPGLLFIF